MSEGLIAIGAAFWLGVLTSISPCALATNIAAVSFLGRTVETPVRAFSGGLLYVIGRTIAYSMLGMLLATGLLAAPALSAFLEGSMNHAVQNVGDDQDLQGHQDQRRAERTRQHKVQVRRFHQR